MDKHRSLWLAEGTPQTLKMVQELELGFKFHTHSQRPGLPGLDGSLCGMWKDATKRSGNVLQEFCVGRKGFPQCRSMWYGDFYSDSTMDPFARLQIAEPNGKKQGADGRDGLRKVPMRKRRLPYDGGRL